MIVKSRLIIAAAVLAGSASVAFAQSYPFDGTPDSTLSYGPKPLASVGPRVAAPAPIPMGGPNYPFDGTPDSTLSYGPKPAQAAVRSARAAPIPMGGPNYAYDGTPDKTLSYGPISGR